MSNTKHTKRAWTNAERRRLVRIYATTLDIEKTARVLGRSANSTKMQLWRLAGQFSVNPGGRVKRPTTYNEAMALATAFEYHTDQLPELDLTTRRTTVDERQRLTEARAVDQMSGTNYELLPPGWTYTGWGPPNLVPPMAHQPPTNHGVYDEDEHPEPVRPFANTTGRVFVDMAGNEHGAGPTSVVYLWGAIERTTRVVTNGNGYRATQYPWVQVTKWHIHWPWSMVVRERLKPGTLRAVANEQTPGR